MMRQFIFIGFFITLSSLSCKKTDNANPNTPTQPGTENPPPINFVERTVGQTAQKIEKVTGNVDQYLLQIPTDYNTKKSQKWPVIIFLHGVGERGSDLSVLQYNGPMGVLMKDKSLPFIAIAPQCKKDTWWNNTTLNALYDEITSKYNVDKSRIYLTGLSMGGNGAWEWALSDASKFAALVPISGWGNNANACNLKNMPIWAFHNADDATVAVNGSRSMIAAIKACGGTPKYTENPTGGHDAWSKAYADPALYQWLLQQKKP